MSEVGIVTSGANLRVGGSVESGPTGVSLNLVIDPATWDLQGSGSVRYDSLEIRANYDGNWDIAVGFGFGINFLESLFNGRGFAGFGYDFGAYDPLYATATADARFNLIPPSSTWRTSVRAGIRMPIGNWLSDLFGQYFFRRDLLVLDLDLGGVSLTALTASNVHFDLDGDGYAERTGWVSSGDGLLALDLNGNGLIDNGGELFGTAQQDGFTVLRAYDSNGDNQISNADTVYANLRVWRDANQDGVSQSSELVSLVAAGVANDNETITVRAAA